MVRHRFRLEGREGLIGMDSIYGSTPMIQGFVELFDINEWQDHESLSV